MKPTYSNLTLTTGRYIAGISKIQFVPREWITTDLLPAYSTGVVDTEVILEIGKTWLTLELADDTYEFEAKPKTSRNGEYFETTIQGVLNDITPELQIILHTLRHHEMVALVKDKKRRLRLVGTKENGLRFSLSNKESNNQGGNQVVAINMSMEYHELAPFYVV